MNAAPTSSGLQGDNALHYEDAYDTRIDAGANMTISDPDNANFAGGTLRIQIGNARTNEDNLVRFLSGNRVAFNPGQVTPIGTVSVGDDADVVINLSAAATAASVQNFLRELYYFNPAAIDPTPGWRPITITLTDGAGGTLVITSTVEVIAVNDRPEGTDVTRTIGTEATYAFTLADFGFRDWDGGTFDRLIISRLPTRGGIYIDPGRDGLHLVPVSAGQHIPLDYLDGRLVYVPEGHPSDLTGTDFEFQVRDDGGTKNGGEDTSCGNLFTFEFTYGDGTGQPGAPVITGITGDESLFTEGGYYVYVDVNADAAITDGDHQSFVGHEFNVSIVSGYREGDRLMFKGAAFLWNTGGDGNTHVIVEGQSIGHIVSMTDGGISILLGHHATPYLVSQLMKSVVFVSESDALPEGYEERRIRFFVGDHQGNDASATASVFVRGYDDAPVAANDYAEVDENKTVIIPIFDNDSDPDTPLVVREIDGNAVEIGQTVTLGSGARVTLNADGTLTYDPNGSFDSLPGPETGAANSSHIETFYYLLQGMESWTAVDVRIAGITSSADRIEGSTEGDAFIGGGARDVFLLHQGGDDTVSGHGGVDTFYFGAEFTPADRVDGGDDRDSLMLQGYYRITFGTDGVSNIAGIEGISLMPGSNTSFGLYGGPYSYDLTLVDGNVAAGALMKINGFHLEVGEAFTLDASAETDAPLQVFGGRGADDLTGGAMGDTFVFGHDGRFAAGDKVDGGAGYDLFYLRGDYAIDFNDPAFAGALTGIESIGLLTSANTEFLAGGDGDFDYQIVWSDALLADGATMTVNGSRLQPYESFTFDGSAETGGRLRVFGGGAADVLTGGGGNDQIHGGGGADSLAGGAGADLFRYSSVADSNAAAFDTIAGFVAGEDRIDVNRVDAKASTPENEAFAFIGDAAFSAAGADAPGELRAFHIAGGLWQVEADVNGDGVADLMVRVEVAGGEILTVADFVV